MKKPHIVIIVGASGSGKSALEAALEKDGYYRSISATTREIRDGEEDGVHYHFIPKNMFKKDMLFEYYQNEKTGHFYGTPKAPVLDAYLGGKPVVMILERVGVEKMHKAFMAMGIKDYRVLFVSLPGKTVKEKKAQAVSRMQTRGDSAESIQERLDAMDIKQELTFFEDLYDKEFVNDDKGVMIAAVRSYLAQEFMS